MFVVGDRVSTQLYAVAHCMNAGVAIGFESSPGLYCTLPAPLQHDLRFAFLEVHGQRMSSECTMPYSQDFASLLRDVGCRDKHRLYYIVNI